MNNYVPVTVSNVMPVALVCTITKMVIVEINYILTTFIQFEINPIYVQKVSTHYN